MKITTTTVSSIDIADNWQAIYQFTDLGPVNKVVQITIPYTFGTPPIPGDPNAVPPIVDIPATPATQQYIFNLWTGADYDAANALNGGSGYGNSDLVTGITNYLANVTTS